MAIKRSQYLSRIVPFMGTDLIKVFTGQRRVGKSFLLRQVQELLLKKNPQAKMVYINKEDFSFDHIRTYADLITFVEQEKGEHLQVALLIDEIQDIVEFERALRHFQTRQIYDIYCTGSNAKMLSGDLATLLSGRSIEITVYSLSYPEFLIFHGLTESVGAFEKYLHFGSMPNLIHFEMTDTLVYEYLRNIYNTIMVKDIITRHSIRNVSFLENLTKYVADNTGSIVSAKKISDYLKSQRITLSPVTVQDYLAYLVEAFLVHRVSRTGLQGKKIFEIGEKFYFNDIGMRNSLVGHRVTDIGKILENVVFLHLKMAGYSVTVGQERDKEVDFIAQKNNEFLYIQVCYLLSQESTIAREFGILKQIPDNYPKMVVSYDPGFPSSVGGIRHMNIRQFCVEILEGGF